MKSKKRKWEKSIYKPINPEKYVGEVEQIIARSSWERQLMIEFDKNPSIKKWASEEIIVGYRCPFTGRKRRYFPDFLVRTENGDIFLIEVKPDKQTRPPVTPSRRSRRYLEEVKTWGLNRAKWEAAEKFCESRGWNWLILTEKNIGFFR